MKPDPSLPKAYALRTLALRFTTGLQLCSLRLGTPYREGLGLAPVCKAPLPPSNPHPPAQAQS